MNRKFKEDESEIDLLEIAYMLWKKLWLILIVTIAGFILAGMYTVFCIQPTYKSTSVLYIISKSTTLASVADLDLGTKLAGDYEILIKSRPTLEQVIENLDLDMTPGQLKKCVTTENPSNTHMMNITVTYTNPEMATKIANELATVTQERVPAVMAQDQPRIAEEAVVPTSKSAPNTKKNCMIGAMIGFVLICAILIVRFLMDNTIRTEEDVEHYLGLTTLALIPNEENKSIGDSLEHSGSNKKKHKSK